MKQETARKSKAGVFTLSSNSLIVCEGLINIVVMFLDTFLVSKLLKLTPGNYTSVAIFNLLYYGLVGVTAFCIAPLFRKIKPGVFVSIGALIMAGLFVVVYLLGDNIANWIWLLGAISGIGYGIFGASFDNLVGESISSKNQTIYFSVKNIIIFLVKTIFPLILGAIVDFGSFPLMCIILAVVCVLIFVFTFFVKNEKRTNRTFKPIEFLKIVKNGGEETKPLKTLYLSAIFRGLSFNLIATVFTVLLFLNVGAGSAETNYKIGLVKTIFTAIQMISMFIFLKMYHKRRAKIFLFGALGIILASAIPVFFEQNLTTILIIFGAYNIFRIFITTITDMRTSAVIRLLSMHTHIIEHTAIYTLIYRLCDGLCYLLFLLWFVLPENIMILIILGFALIFFILYTITLFRLEKQLIEQDKRWKAAHPDEGEILAEPKKPAKIEILPEK